MIMTAKTVATIMILLFNVKICQSRNYEMYTLYSATPTDMDQLKFLQNLDAQKYIDVMFWKKPSRLFEDAHLIVSPDDNKVFIERTNHFKLKPEVILQDIEQAFKAQYIKKGNLRRNKGKYSWKFYHSLEDIYQWLADLAGRYPHVKFKSIGKSTEGRHIYAISLTKPGNKYKVIVEGGIHGNEWVAVEFVTFLVNELIVQSNSKHWRIHELSRKYNWHIIPIINPDGYVYSQTKDRLWRKNRKQTINGTGVDINRNFDYEFGNFGASHQPNDENYCGTHAFSERESKILADFVEEQKQRLQFYFTFHSYGQKLIIPYSGRVKHIDNFSEMENYGKQAILKMYRAYGTKYSVGTTFDTLGQRITGNSASWVKKHYGVRYVFTFLLRDNGSYGYALPSSQILPTCDEAASGLAKLMVAKPRRVQLDLFSPSKAQDLRAVIFTLFCTFYIVFL